ncbi:hypothetical protein QQ045_026098 [Rhodiola kirilowii]
MNQALTWSNHELDKQIELIRCLLSSMEDGEISVSAYDTAWVALVENVNNKSGMPQFPTALEWISKNQLADGSWGDSLVFLAHDRILNTLACVIALKTWNNHPKKIQKGLKFIMENMGKLEGEDAQHMPAGFEVILPSLLDMAKALGMAEVADMPCIRHIYAKRDEKLARIPKELMHNIPTTLHHSLEGMVGLDWTKLLKLQCEDGSFLFSIASTAFALMQTKDEKCLNYLQNIVDKFRVGVPSFYPISIYERLWAVDKVERLGISRYFQTEIMDCLSYVHRYWNEKGLSWTEPSPLKDLDDTVMGFRLLRLYGFHVSPDVIRNFKKGYEFMCFPGQMLEGPTVMYNLYRASQVQFPGETILEEAKRFSLDFLRNKQASGEIFDKWMILKDLPGEIGYALDVPWYASLPRLEARVFIDQYGGEDDACIAKNIYRLPKTANNVYLELAKSDYNNCQAVHQLEWDALQKWYAENKILRTLGIRPRNLLVSYYLAAATIFEPERCIARLAWAKSSILIESIISYFRSHKDSGETCKKTLFLEELSSVVNWTNSESSWICSDPYNVGRELALSLRKLLHELSMELRVANGAECLTLLVQAWEKWLRTADSDAEVGGSVYGNEAELLVQTINICTRERTCDTDHVYPQLWSVANKLCTQLRQWNIRQLGVNGESTTREDGESTGMSAQIDSGMQLLVQLVLENKSSSNDGSNTFLMVARSFYYTAYFDSLTVDRHINKILFEAVK